MTKPSHKFIGGANRKATEILKWLQYFALMGKK
jgi:hypothetical protein